MHQPSPSDHSEAMWDLSNWVPIVTDPKRDWQGRALRLQCRSRDPSLISPMMDLSPSELAVLCLTMSAQRKEGRRTALETLASLYLATDTRPGFSEERCFHFRVFPDGHPREYILLLKHLIDRVEPDERIRQLRFDPMNCPGVCVIESFSIRPVGHSERLRACIGTDECLANDLSLKIQFEHGSEVCMGYPELVFALSPSSSLSAPEMEAICQEVLPRTRRVTLAVVEAEGRESTQALENLVALARSHQNLIHLMLNADHDLQDRLLDAAYPNLDRVTLLPCSQPWAGEEGQISARRDLASQGTWSRLLAWRREGRRNLLGNSPSLIVSLDASKEANLDAARLAPWSEKAGADGVRLRGRRLDGCENGPTPKRPGGLPLFAHSFVPGERPVPANVSWCSLPWLQMVIGPAGMIHPCLGPASSRVLGEFHPGRAFEAWNAPAYREMRRLLGQPQMPEECRHCADRFAPSSL